MSQKTILYLLRHAQSQPDLNTPTRDWPLSDLGVTQADALVALLSKLGIRRIFSSPYRRALATVAPFARAGGLEVSTVPNLREQENHLVGTEPEFRSLLMKMWADFDYRPPGGETLRECQARMTAAVRDLAGDCDGSTALISSHGNAIGLFLNHLEPGFGYEHWRAMRNPDLFRIRFESGEFSWDRRWAISAPPWEGRNQ